MATTIRIYDETTSGERSDALTLDFLTEVVTVRELIRARVYQEVTEYNAKQPARFTGLIQPVASERRLNGERSTLPRRIDLEAQYSRALDAFARNGFLLLVDDRQIMELDEEVTLRHDTSVTFLRLVPLVGG
jgi:hypothetical protein